MSTTSPLSIYNVEPSIIFTIGPSTCTEAILEKILTHNVSYVRFNMSHATHDEHHVRLCMVRDVAKKLDKDIKVFIDLCGPKIRVKELSAQEVTLDQNDTLAIVQNNDALTLYKHACVISYDELYQHVRKGTVIALDDGKIMLLVDSVDTNNAIICTVTRGGVLINEKGVNIIDTDIRINPFTQKDEEDALFGLSEHVDAIALSFVKRKEDIDNLRAFITSHTNDTVPIIAKIETRQALHGIGGILEATDMIMVARGDLGIEIPVQKIPLVQKELAYLACKHEVPVIVATEMLKSMTKNPFPTRAEISDCMDALIDGAQYIMLSDETTTGTYPLEAIEVMDSIIKEFVNNKHQYQKFMISK